MEMISTAMSAYAAPMPHVTALKPKKIGGRVPCRLAGHQELGGPEFDERIGPETAQVDEQENRGQPAQEPMHVEQPWSTRLLAEQARGKQETE